MTKCTANIRIKLLCCVMLNFVGKTDLKRRFLISGVLKLLPVIKHNRFGNTHTHRVRSRFAKLSHDWWRKHVNCSSLFRSLFRKPNRRNKITFETEFIRLLSYNTVKIVVRMRTYVMENWLWKYDFNCLFRVASFRIDDCCICECMPTKKIAW